jgi:hypothetical protein
MAITTFPQAESGAAGGYDFKPITSVQFFVSPALATISLTGIDPKYRALKLVITGQGVNVGSTFSSGASHQIYYRFNNDTANTYESNFRQLSTTTWTASSGRAAGINNAIVIGGNTANEQAAVLYIYETNAASVKTISGFGRTGSATSSELTAAYWNNTAILNQIDIVASGGTFLQGTAFLLGSE